MNTRYIFQNYPKLLYQFCVSNYADLLKVVLINLFLILLMLNGLEHYFRPEPEMSKNGMFQGKHYTWGHLVVHNQYGFREREFASPKPKGIFRVMVLGDSLTWGAGLSMKQRYTSIAEELLNQSSLGLKFEVLNFAESSGPTTNERNLLNKFKEIVQPDLIVVGFCLNDPQPKSQDYSVERSEYLTSTTYGIIYNISKLLRSMGLPFLGKVVDEGSYRIAEGLGIVPTWQVALQRTYEEHSDGWKEFVMALKDIKVASEAMGLQRPIFAILNQGVSLDEPTDYNRPNKDLKIYLNWYHQAEETARRSGFRTYNHEQEIARYLNDEPLSVNRHDGHPSANLNKLYGKKLSQIIIKELVPIL